MGQGTFTASVSEWIAKSRKRMEAVAIGSAQDAAEMMTRPVAKGGRMRVDTGYLRASFRASVDTPVPINPAGRPAKDAKPGSYAMDGGYALVIAGWELRSPLFLTFTASYARPREYKGDAFVATTAAAWQQIVSANAAKAVRAFP